ncbi:MAG TPA: hypothetical protein VKH35_11680 [Thermoanaerobaculia bacterium]|nr:hypothetical protein [Thermoanaerobaculia bacterium]
MRAVLVAALCLLAGAALADEPQRTDYSEATLLRMFAPPLDGQLPPGRVQWHSGWVEFRALHMNWRVFYLPLFAPLSSARLAAYSKIPNPFELTGTPYASTMPPMFDNDRSPGVQREYRRIERMMRKQ